MQLCICQIVLLCTIKFKCHVHFVNICRHCESVDTIKSEDTVVLLCPSVNLNFLLGTPLKVASKVHMLTKNIVQREIIKSHRSDMIQWSRGCC